MSDSYPYHVFAHEGGRYQTVKSVGVTSAEGKILEQFFFGQTNNTDYLASLSAEPGIIWRVTDTQGALTRVRQGNNDLSGRMTLRFETILVPRAKGKAALQDFDAVVLANWEFGANGATVVPNPSFQPSKVHPDRVSDVVMAVRGGRRVTRRAATYSLRDVGKIISACWDATSFSLCFKSLNNAAPVDVNLLWVEASERDMPKTAAAPIRTATNRQRVEAGSHNAPTSNLLILAGVYVTLAIQILIFWSGTSRQNPSGSFDQMQGHLIARMEKVKEDINVEHRKSLEKLKNDFQDRFKEAEGRFAESLTPLQQLGDSNTKKIETAENNLSGRLAELEKHTIVKLDEGTKRTEDIIKSSLKPITDELTTIKKLILHPEPKKDEDKPKENEPQKDPPKQ